MPDIDPKLGLTLPLVTDPFETSVIRGNWEKLAQHPGILSVGNASLLPSNWNANHQGMVVYQADAKILYVWDGESFQRLAAKGWLASDTTTTDVTCSTSYTTLAQTTASVPPGGRRVEITGSWSEVTARTRFALYRGDTQLTEQFCALGSGGTIFFNDLPGTSSPTYQLRARAVTGSTVVRGSIAIPINLSIKEV